MPPDPVIFTSGRPFGKGARVTMVDSVGAPVSGATDSITVSLASGTGTLAGTTTLPLVGGTATFPDLQITGAGAFTLRFSDTKDAALQVVSPPVAVFTLIAEADMSEFPWVGGMSAGHAVGLSKPSSLHAIVKGANLPVPMPGGTAFRHIIAAGTAAGYPEPPGQYAEFKIWDNPIIGANGGPADTEYSAVYIDFEFCLYGNGTSFETPPTGFKFPGYFGVTNNNQDPNGSGPTQIISGPYLSDGTNTIPSASTNPITSKEFYYGMFTQNAAGKNRNLWQNLNLSKHIVVGKIHRLEMAMSLGTNGRADGTVDMWLDGVHIVSYNDVEYIDSNFASSTGTGLAGFWGLDFDPVWGGFGGANKSRDDAIYIGPIRISGIFLRNPL